MNGKEISNYPENSNIVWKDNKRTFYYKVIKAGIYPKDILCTDSDQNYPASLFYQNYVDHHMLM
jgi:hypothetical protein